VVDSRGTAPRRNREIHARIVQHPFRVIRLRHRGLRGKQRRVEADRMIEIIDRDMDMKPLHRSSPVCAAL